MIAQGLAIAALVVTGIVSPRWPADLRPWLAPAAVPLLAGGLALALGGLRGLGRQMTALPMPVAGGRLQQHGAYALVRHPMYGGVLLLMLGWTLLMSPLALAPWVTAALFLDAKRRREEIWLAARHPEYAAYKRRVKRAFLPLVW